MYGFLIKNIVNNLIYVENQLVSAGTAGKLPTKLHDKYKVLMDLDN